MKISSTSHCFLAPVALLTIAGCLDGSEPAVMDDTATAQLAIGIDDDPEQPPSPDEIVPAAFSVQPGVRACYPELSAANSAGIGGYFSFSNFVKYPKLIVFWRPNTSSSQSRIFGGPVIPDSSGYYERVFNRTSNPGLFPGLFQFCLKNAAVNPGPFYSTATTVTF